MMTIDDQTDDNDPTKERVYEWERACVQAKVQREVLSRNGCVEAIHEAALFLGINSPKVRFPGALSSSCYADVNNWVMSISDWGRSRPVILHEMAHLALKQEILAGEPMHGESFVRMAIRLYSKLLGLDAQNLASLAVAYRILDKSAIADFRPNASESKGFFDGEF